MNTNYSKKERGGTVEVMSGVPGKLNLHREFLLIMMSILLFTCSFFIE